MADMTFNTTAGQTVDRELLIAYLNTGEAGTPHVVSPRYARHRFQHGIRLAGGFLEGYSRHNAHHYEETHHHADL